MNHGEFNFANFAPFATGVGTGLLSFIILVIVQLYGRDDLLVGRGRAAARPYLFLFSFEIWSAPGCGEYSRQPPPSAW
jgi:hypothetical protein